MFKIDINHRLIQFDLVVISTLLIPHYMFNSGFSLYSNCGYACCDCHRQPFSLPGKMKKGAAHTLLWFPALVRHS